jgi:2-keto-4-pentenoate hydratase/2-oxohepta-3-ene-1,7-dioic acid hydratase in catechol pathway
MKIARFEHEGAERVGVVDCESVRPLARGTDVLDLLADRDTRERAADAAGDGVALDAVRLLAPLKPASFRDFLTFEEHLAGMVMTHAPGKIADAWYEIPTFYFTNVAAVTGPYDDVPMPPGCEVLDFELELAAIIGKPGRDLTPDQAHEHIAGYTIFNDWSARDLQTFEMQIGLGPAKGKDTANTLGPWIVTADELEHYRRDDRMHLEMEAFRNGERWGGDTAANMRWSFEQLVAYASRGTVVRPGDVLGSGTCGAGCLGEIWGRRGRRDPAPLAPGDEIELRIEGIGAIRNRVVEGPARVDIGPSRPAQFPRERSW